MKTWKSGILVAALALTTSPLFATPQGTTTEQGQGANPPAASQPQAQSQPEERHRRHHRRRHRRRHQTHHRRHTAMLLYHRTIV